MKRRRAASRVKLNHYAVWQRLNRLNMTQNGLAHEVGVTPGYLSQLMSGTRCPSARVRRKLQDTLGVVRFDELFIIEVVA